MYNQVAQYTGDMDIAEYTVDMYVAQLHASKDTLVQFKVTSAHYSWDYTFALNPRKIVYISNIFSIGRERDRDKECNRKRQGERYKKRERNTGSNPSSRIRSFNYELPGSKHYTSRAGTLFVRIVYTTCTEQFYCTVGRIVNKFSIQSA